MAGKVKIVKVNIDENRKLIQYGVRGIPTLLIFDKGEVKAEKIGAAPKSKLSEWVGKAYNPAYRLINQAVSGLPLRHDPRDIRTLR